MRGASPEAPFSYTKIRWARSDTTGRAAVDTTTIKSEGVGKEHHD